MAEYLIAYGLTKGNEGNILTNEAVDKGRLSYAGISSIANPEWYGWAIIRQKNLQLGQSLPELNHFVLDFYKVNYWNPIGGDAIADQDLANQVFDMAVNSGVGTALKLLKQS